MRRFVLALVFALLFQGRGRAQEEAAADEPAESSEEGDAPAPKEKAETPAPAPRVVKATRAKKPPPAPKVGKDGLHWARKPRKGAKLLGAVVPEERLRAAPPPRPSG